MNYLSKCCWLIQFLLSLLNFLWNESNTLSDFSFTVIPWLIIWSITLQKQPPKAVFNKRCSENMQQILPLTLSMNFLSALLASAVTLWSVGCFPIMSVEYWRNKKKIKWKVVFKHLNLDKAPSLSSLYNWWLSSITKWILYILLLAYSVFQREATMKNSVKYKLLLRNGFVSQMQFALLSANCETKEVNINGEIEI